MKEWRAEQLSENTHKYCMQGQKLQINLNWDRISGVATLI